RIGVAQAKLLRLAPAVGRVGNEPRENLIEIEVCHGVIVRNRMEVKEPPMHADKRRYGGPKRLSGYLRSSAFIRGFNRFFSASNISRGMRRPRAEPSEISFLFVPGKSLPPVLIRPKRSASAEHFCTHASS